MICATIDELPNEVGQSVAWAEDVVFNVDRRAPGAFLQRCLEKGVCRASCTDKSKVGRLLESMYGCQDAGVNWEFAICQVMIAIGFVQN